MSEVLSEAAERIISAGLQAGRERDFEAADRAVEKAVVELSFETPQGYKAQVTDALIQIAKAHVREHLGGN